MDTICQSYEEPGDLSDVKITQNHEITEIMIIDIQFYSCCFSLDKEVENRHDVTRDIQKIIINGNCNNKSISLTCGLTSCSRCKKLQRYSLFSNKPNMVGRSMLC